LRHDMPAGNEALLWQRLLTEIQMILHNHPVNQQRQRQGYKAINNVWLWGEGILPTTKKVAWQKVIGDTVLSQGIAKFFNIDWYAVAELKEGAGEKVDNALIVIEKLFENVVHGEIAAWQRRLVALDKVLFGPLLEGLKSKSIKEITFVTEQETLQITSSLLKKFWRKKKPLATLIQ